MNLPMNIKTEPNFSLINYRNASPIVDESRATHPAWMYKDLEQTRWEQPFLNPQNNWNKPFDDNLQSRILEKDLHMPKIPTVEH